MGTHAGATMRPLTKAQCEKMMVKNTVSQAWRLGRAVALANKTSNIGQIGPILVDSLGGDSTARVLFSGKIIEVGRRIYKGHTVGEVIIQSLAMEDEEVTDGNILRFEGKMTSQCSFRHMYRLYSLRGPVPFKNENLYCEHIVNGESKVSPDLHRAGWSLTPPVVCGRCPGSDRFDRQPIRSCSGNTR